MAAKHLTAVIFSLLFLSSCAIIKPIPNNAQIEFERTPCYGTCPIFKLTIDHKGNAVFEGERFTDKLGRWTYKLNKSERKDIFNAFKAVNWDKLNANYPTAVSDLPSVIFHFTHKKTDKEVVVTGAHPAELDLLATKMDNLVANGLWVKDEAK